MNIGNELAQIKYCKNADEIVKFLEDHNLKFDHWYADGTTLEDSKSKIYVVAYYQEEFDGVFIHLTFNF